MADQKQERIETSESGGAKGTKLVQPTLIAPYIRDQWIEEMQREEKLTKSLASACRYMIAFEESTEHEYDRLGYIEDGAYEHLVSRCNGDHVRAMQEMGLRYGFGSRKYSRTNYLSGYEWSKTMDAFWRHVLADASGERHDAEAEGALHASAVAWHATTLRIFHSKGLGVDDRIWIPKGLAAF